MFASWCLILAGSLASFHLRTFLLEVPPPPNGCGMALGDVSISSKILNSCLESHLEVTAGGLQLGAVGLEAISQQVRRSCRTASHMACTGRAVPQVSRAGSQGRLTPESRARRLLVFKLRSQRMNLSGERSAGALNIRGRGSVSPLVFRAKKSCHRGHVGVRPWEGNKAGPGYGLLPLLLEL